MCRCAFKFTDFTILKNCTIQKIPFTEKVYLKNVELNIIALIDFEFTDNYEKCSETVLKSFTTRFQRNTGALEQLDQRVQFILPLEGLQDLSCHYLTMQIYFVSRQVCKMPNFEVFSSYQEVEVTRQLKKVELMKIIFVPATKIARNITAIFHDKFTLWHIKLLHNQV